MFNLFSILFSFRNFKAKYIYSGGSKMNETQLIEDNSPLLEQDKLLLRQNYDSILRVLKPGRDLVAALQEKNLLSDQDFHRLSNDSDGKKIEYLIFKLLVTEGTYKVLDTLRQVLAQIGQQEVLQYLPTGEDDVSDDSDDQGENGHDTTSVSGGGLRGEDPVNTGVVTSDDGTTKALDEVDSQSDSSDDCETVRAAGIGSFFKRKGTESKKKESHPPNYDRDMQPETDVQSRNVAKACDIIAINVSKKKKKKVIINPEDAFLSYQPKDPRKPHGTGLCAIFALFTEDLTGYKKDVIGLEEFYSELDYQVWSGGHMENLTRAQLFSQISAIRQEINNNHSIDRLVVVILSHGKPDGLLSCADDSGELQEEHEEHFRDARGVWFKRYVPVKTKIEEIVDCFKHDSLPSMKDMPKLFLVQACRGKDVVQSANVPASLNGQDDVDGYSEVDGQDLDMSQLILKSKSPIDGDIMVCHATTDNHSSLVNPHTGSWFIQKTLDVFRRHYRTEHVADMMTVVNLAVAEMRGTIKHDNAPSTLAVQMPCIFSTLRRRFYLYKKSG